METTCVDKHERKLIAKLEAEMAKQEQYLADLVALGKHIKRGIDDPADEEKAECLNEALTEFKADYLFR